jgi:hypothetical protein
MRLRVRLADGGETHKLSLPEVCDVAHLRQRVASALQLETHHDFGLSLNKREDLTSGVAESATLRSCGIASGDLLFVIRRTTDQGEGVSSVSTHPDADTGPERSAYEVECVILERTLTQMPQETPPPSSQDPPPGFGPP